ncbi:hypothetical protein CC80DRAFT_585066 [Byssothecium circinans]|uniref:Uncharacterized protein n=1 Tax=Byssothecium circinans TaxID=147558 RepID=A0A6A5T616_9PLEO|nr:hypothetical protein CC80DRAFT_585066 [Byssothecium circinans]
MATLVHTPYTTKVEILANVPGSTNEEDFKHKYGYGPITILHTAYELRRTLAEWEKHTGTTQTDLKTQFLQAAHWTYNDVLRLPLDRLRTAMTPFLDDDFLGIYKGKQIPKATLQLTVEPKTSRPATYREIFAEAEGVLQELDDQVSVFPGVVQIIPHMMPTRNPRELLVEIALHNKLGEPKAEKLHQLVQAERALDLNFSSNIQSPFKIPKPRYFPSKGTPSMYSVAISPHAQNQWLVGATVTQLLTFEGAQPLFKSIRAIQLGDTYINLCERAEQYLKANDIMKGSKDKQERLNARKRLLQEIKGEEVHMSRSGDHGIALHGDLTTELNCFRCRAVFSFDETPAFPQETIDKEIKDWDWDAHKGSHACAEAVSVGEVIAASVYRYWMLMNSMAFFGSGNVPLQVWNVALSTKQCIPATIVNDSGSTDGTVVKRKRAFMESLCRKKYANAEDALSLLESDCDGPTNNPNIVRWTSDHSRADPTIILPM